MTSQKLMQNWQFETNGKTQAVTLPHDFMLATPRTPDSKTCADFGYFQPCRGTYTRTLQKTQAARHFLKFDGVMGMTEVWVNSSKVCFHPYGYTAFVCDITPYLHDGENEIRVQADATAQSASRWYTGAGLYREVELLTCDEDYLLPWGLCVKVLHLPEDDAAVEFTAEIFAAHCGKAALTFAVPELGFTTVQHLWLCEGKNTYRCKAVLHGAKRWTPDDPVLYTCKASLQTDFAADTDETSFGVRTVICDAENGLLLNNRPIKLYGTCDHHDNGIVGAASYRSAEERRVRILKENGFNAIRCAHNPPSKMLLDVCDKLGMLVIDEMFDCWRMKKRDFDYHLWFDTYMEEDVSSVVRRDRNHPCIILWSTGNEIADRAGDSDGYRSGKRIADCIRALDDTRPLTHAFCEHWENPAYLQQEKKTFSLPAEQTDFWSDRLGYQFSNLEVLGYNYQAARIEKDVRRFPGHLFIITESFPMDAVMVKKMMDKEKKLVGEFVWTGWDYFGETGIGHVNYEKEKTEGLTQYPSHIADCGDFSICGFKKAPSYYRDAAWQTGSVRILTADPANSGKPYAISRWGFYDVARTWTYPGKEGQQTTVSLYSVANECELFCNGVSFGKKAPDEKGIATFTLPYEPGILTAKAYINGVLTGEDTLSTANPAQQLVLTPDLTGKTGKADLLYVEISLCDQNGQPAWNEDSAVTVRVQGGSVVGTGNGKVDSLHDYTAACCEAYHGKLLAAILPESDTVTVKAVCGALSAEGTYSL